MQMGGALHASIAVYACLSEVPLVSSVRAYDPPSLVARLAADVHARVSSTDSSIPHISIQEVLENLIHASFSDVVISIMESGHILRIADRGPGVHDKREILLPGFTTATQQMRRYIRGVGSGLPLANAHVTASGGYISIEDNLGSGTVVTLYSRKEYYLNQQTQLIKGGAGGLIHKELDIESIPRNSRVALSGRCKKVMSLTMEYGEVGPSLIAKELKVSLSTAHRDLNSLEQLGLLTTNSFSKRALTQKGILYLNHLFSE